MWNVIKSQLLQERFKLVLVMKKLNLEIYITSIKKKSYHEVTFSKTDKKYFGGFCGA